MAKLTEIERWEEEIYRIEENDPVHGGENGITNKPTKQLANRTLFLRKQLQLAGQKLVPKKITAASRNEADETGHTHEIERGDTTKAGLIQLTNDTGLDSEALALTAKGGKAIAQSVAQLPQRLNDGLNQKANKTDISDAVNSESRTTVASSKAVKTAYDKGVEAKNIADGKVGIAGTETITGEKTFHYNIKIRSNHDASKFGRIGQNGDDLFIQNGYTGYYLALKNDGELRYREWAIHHEKRPYVSVNATNGGYAGLNITRVGTSGSWVSRVEALPDRRWKFWTNSDGRGFEQYIPAKNGTIAFMDDVNARVSKSGDTMTGALKSKHIGVDAYNRQYQTDAPFLVEANSDSARNNFHPFIKGKMRSLGNYGGSFSFGWTSHQGDGNGFGKGTIVWAGDNAETNNGQCRVWSFETNGDFVSAGDVKSANGKNLSQALMLSDVRRRTYSRTVNGDSQDDNGTTRTMNLTGEVIAYPDGKIEQIFNLQHFRDIWFGREDPAVGISNREYWGRLIPIDLWTAMPQKVLYVDAQVLRSSNSNLSGMYTTEAVEQKVGWAIRKQGSNRGKVWIDIGRVLGSHSEHIDLIVKVEGY